MNYKTIPIKEARNNLAELIERAALARESFLITKFGKSKAMIVPVDIVAGREKSRSKALKETFALWKGRSDMKSASLWVRRLRAKESSRYGKVFG